MSELRSMTNIGKEMAEKLTKKELKEFSDFLRDSVLFKSYFYDTCPIISLHDNK